MAFKGMTITNAGKRLLAQAQISKSFSIKCVRIGDGQYTGELADITSLTHKLYDAPCDVIQNDNNLIVQADISSNDYSGYYFREVALIALDSNNEEVIYAYDNAGDDAEYISSSGDIMFEKRLKFLFTISSDIQINIEIAGHLYALNDDVKKIEDRIDVIEEVGVKVADTLPIKGGFVFNGAEEEIPLGFAKATPPFSNPNLLLNSDYRNPINQRGKTTYTEAGKYTIDRWMIINGISLTINSSSITLNHPTTAQYSGRFVQKIERQLKGIHTLSMKVISCNKEISIPNFNKIPQGFSGVFTTTCIEDTILSELALYFPLGGILELEWIKLEAGELATPFIPRSYGEELLLCQRYYSIGYVCMMIINNWSNPYRYNVPMRGVPTISISKQKSGTTGGDVIDDTRVRVSSATNLMMEFIQTSYGGILWFRCVLEQDAEIF